MDFFYSLGSLGSSFVGNVFSFYTSMNSASLSGAVDVIVVEQSDGEYLSTPFHVRFGKYRVFTFEDKYVDIQINGTEISLKMQLGESGVAFFVQKTEKDEKVRRFEATSPLPSDSEHDFKKASAINTTPTITNTRKSRSERAERFDEANGKPHKRRHTTSEGRQRRKRKQKRFGQRGTAGFNITGSLSDTDVDFQLRSPKAQVELVSSDFKRSIRLSSDQLKSLGLKYGLNQAQFSITTKFQGTASCSCHIYLFKQSELLVISDIDGTITKSDVLGHVLPAIGGTWAHAGVAELYTHISENGYQMVYLSSRSIGLSDSTKTYLKYVKQGTRTLPDGPVLLSPTSVMQALRKEVIERRPQEFKIACLTDLKALFPSKEPFVAGFGNRPTDVESYKNVGIPDERIFIINPSGIVSRVGTGFVSDYASMANNMVDFMFPPLGSSKFRTGGLINFLKTKEDPTSYWGNSPKLMDHLVDSCLKSYDQRTEEAKKKKAKK